LEEKSQHSPVELPLRTEEVCIKSGEVTLFGEIHVPDKIPAPAIILFHFMDVRGYHGLKAYSMLAEKACKAGFVSFMFDSRGVGKSTGQFDYGAAEQQDAKRILNYLDSRIEVKANNIFVVGHSLGAAISLYAFQDERRIRGMVLWSPPKDHDYNVKKFIRRTKGRLGLAAFLILSRLDSLVNVSGLFKLEVFGINLRLKEVKSKLMKLNETKMISNLHVPKLIVVGNSDNIHGEDEALAVFDSAHEPKTLVVIESAGPTFEGKEDELISKTLGWIEKAMNNSLEHQ
jgi:alpha/beta superfamily hydrolase